MRASSVADTGGAPDPNMSTTQLPSATGGTIADTTADDVDISTFETQSEAVQAATSLRVKIRDYIQTMELVRGRLQGWASGADVDLTVPGDVEEIPHPEFGGRQWVTSHEDDVPLGILTEMVRLVEYKRKLKEVRAQVDALVVRFDVRPPVSPQ